LQPKQPIGALPQRHPAADARELSDDTGFCFPFHRSRRSDRAQGVTLETVSVARAFVDARLASRRLADFPGALPADLASGYRCQDEAIRLWPDTIVGWKVGRIPAELQAELGADRVIGPVFAKNLSTAQGLAPSVLDLIPGGFAAVEAEYIFRIGRDAPADKTEWTALDALEFVDAELVGVEFAGSPLATINDLGPRVVAADFGNNAGLILGPEIPGWRADPFGGPPCEVFIDGVSAGQGSPASIPGGPPASLAFLLGLAARRGYPLKRGQLITTGAASGIHDIEAGQTARVTFGELGELRFAARTAPGAGANGGNRDHDRRTPPG
jgi:2-keto-4-pentenoate hydratase